MANGRSWGVASVPAASWWTDRVVATLLVVDLVVLVTSLSGLWGTQETVSLVLGLPAFAGLTAALRYAILQSRLHPQRRFGRTPEENRRLDPVLLAGGPVPPEERPAAGRVVWWHLCAHIHMTWNSLAGLVGVTSMLTFDAAGRGHWSTWGVVQVVMLVVALLVHPQVLRDGERWRRIAQDPALVLPPAPGP